MTPESQHASRLKAIIDTAIDGIITIDSRGRIETVNPAAAVLFGYEIPELIGHNISMLMPDPDRSRHQYYIDHYLRTGQQKIIGIGREVKGLKKDGTVFPFRLAISEVEIGDGDERIFTGIIHDLTKEKQAEERLRRYAAELERSNKDLENFAYVSSHDLQEPLRKIQAFGSRIQEREGHRLSDQGRDYLDRMLRAATRLSNLINDLLAFSRVSTRAKPFEPTDLQSIVQEVLSDLELSIREQGAEISVGALPVIDADPVQMMQLFQNLISNSIKFHREDVPPRILISAEMVARAAEEDPEKVSITVHDNGIGFEEKYLDRIFDVFQRLEGARFPGSGIGLAICRKIVQRHQGQISARSILHQGSAFTVVLPVHQYPSHS
ncbi:MAG: PAS domain S-box protein [Bacteroidia bacterium]|nr:PAS domain S-box protein [Bacteroidia bacterium]